MMKINKMRMMSLLGIILLINSLNSCSCDKKEGPGPSQNSELAELEKKLLALEKKEKELLDELRPLYLKFYDNDTEDDFKKQFLSKDVDVSFLEKTRESSIIEEGDREGQHREGQHREESPIEGWRLREDSYREERRPREGWPRERQHREESPRERQHREESPRERQHREESPRERQLREEPPRERQLREEPPREGRSFPNGITFGTQMALFQDAHRAKAIGVQKILIKFFQEVLINKTKAEIEKNRQPVDGIKFNKKLLEVFQVRLEIYELLLKSNEESLKM